MQELNSASSPFPTARCGPCDKTVLTYIGLDDLDREIRYCIHCDGAIGDDLNWIDANALAANGYQIDPPAARAPGGCGSGGGCGSCSMRARPSPA